MKKSIKKIVVVGVIVVALASSFMLGNTYASGGWRDAVTLKAIVDINKAGFDKTAELVTNLDTVVKDTILIEVEPMIDIREQQVEDELQVYFNEKVESLITDESGSMEVQFDGMAQNAIQTNINKIDTAFEGN